MREINVLFFFLFFLLLNWRKRGEQKIIYKCNKPPSYDESNVYMIYVSWKKNPCIKICRRRSLKNETVQTKILSRLLPRGNLRAHHHKNNLVVAVSSKRGDKPDFMECNESSQPRLSLHPSKRLTNRVDLYLNKRHKSWTTSFAICAILKHLFRFFLSFFLSATYIKDSHAIFVLQLFIQQVNLSRPNLCSFCLIGQHLK